LYRGFHQLGLSFPATIEVYGCQHGQRSHVWQYSFQVNTTQDHAGAFSTTWKSIFPKKAKQMVLVFGLMGLFVGTTWHILGENEKIRLSNAPYRSVREGVENVVVRWPSKIWPAMVSRIQHSTNNLAVTLNLKEPPQVATLPSWESLQLENQFRGFVDTVNQAKPDITISIKAVGDMIPSKSFGRHRLPQKPEILLQSVKPLLQDADLVFGNFESTFTNHPTTPKNIASPRVYAFRTPPEYAHHLHAAGFDVLNIANNHSFDFGRTGWKDTINHIQNAQMHVVGRKNRSSFVNVKGFTIAWMGFSYLSKHNDLRNLEAAKTLVQKADAQADLVIVSVHAGGEGTGALRVSDRTEYFFGENRGNIAAFSKTAIQAGADLIIGHGPHVPRGLELYQNRLIAYSLGNFLGYRTLPTKAQLGDSLVLEVKLDPTGKFQTGKILPVRLDSQGIPHPDPKSRSVRLIRLLTQRDFPHTPLTIDDKGVIHATK
jgi:poly-gamma-glutamate capsule biosynthesis protein CapA/YwtB (metallophosphatase superfamily)